MKKSRNLWGAARAPPLEPPLSHMPSPPLILSDGPYAGQEVRERSSHAPRAPPYIGAHVMPARRLRVQEIQTVNCAQESAVPAVYKPVLHAGWASKPPNATALAEVAACRVRALEIIKANPLTAEQKALLRKSVEDWQ